MMALSRLSTRRPGVVLGLWAAAIAVLAVLGLGVEERLSQSVLTIPGTESKRAIELARQEFGDSVTLPILLEGPPAEIDRQGPELARALGERRDMRVLTPWDRAKGAERLRPEPDAAMIVAAVDRPLEEAFADLAPEMRALVDANVSEPLEARVTGQPMIGNALKEESFGAARKAERIAVPILLVVLLLVFRSPVAAAIPALAGLATVLAGFGAIWVLAGLLEIDPIATSLASMMGLALGVDYSLLIVSRFREEIAAGRDGPEASRIASATAGRTVLFAGVALLVAMLVALAISPGDLLLSASIGVIVATALSVASAFVAMPAALALLGGSIDRWRIGSGSVGSPRWLAAVRASLARPLVVAALILVPLLLLSTPALALDTGPPDVGQLPSDNQARKDYERVREVMGPGWAAPFDVIVVSEQGTITSRERLRKLERWQRRVNRLDNVRSVVGPGRLRSEAKAARRAERQLKRGSRGLAELADGVRRAERGVEQLDAGIDEAAAAAGELDGGSERAAAGAAELEGRLGAAAGGAELIRGAVEEARRGARKLERGLADAEEGAERLAGALEEVSRRVERQAVTGAERLAEGLLEGSEDLERLREPAQSAEGQLDRALDALEEMTVGKADPRYPEALDAVARAQAAVTGRDPITGQQLDPSYPGLDESLARGAAELREAADAAGRLADGARELSAATGELALGARELDAGIEGLADGQSELRHGLERISGALVGLRDGIERLAGGAGELEDGLRELSGGGGRLASELAAGGGRTGALVSGLDEAASGAERLSEDIGDARARQQRRSPGLFDSGYFVLAGVEGAPRRQREQAQFAVNVDRGGEAGRVLIVPGSAPNAEGTRALQDELDERTERLAGRIGAEAALGGPAASLADYDEVTSNRLGLLIAALAIVSYLVLVPVFRSLLLPAIAVLLNLLSVAAAFGALALLFQGADPLLGGPGYLDAVSVTAIYTVIFGLSLDYQVFLITRMREGWERSGETAAAISYGLERTAAVVTGAAAIMTGVFVAFAFTEVANTRQFGVGLTIAVLLDATVVRLLLLPAAIRLAGDAAWTLPGWLERRLPRLQVD